MLRLAVLAASVPLGAGLAPASPVLAGGAPATTPPLACEHFATCSGCVVESDFGETEMVVRARSVLEPLLGAPLRVVCGSPFGWRTQARLAFRWT